ncbi:hypothetical protein OPIT5_00140 (plasmid) [Opitutaceae bacterium TAV5]|nr:hypothetical protein OPIT5_00140 [Opitutaceae bacterium TAV5]
MERGWINLDKGERGWQERGMESKTGKTLEERLREYPEVYGQMERIVEELEQAGEGAGRLDEVEERVAQMVRQLGQETMGGCARRMAAGAPEPGGRKVHRHRKKKSGG